MARLVAQKMSENLRTTVFVENKVGGNFIPALRELTGSPADGHTPLFHFDQHADHPAVASGLSVRSHATDTCHASRDRTADPGREEQPGHQDAGRVDQPRQDESGKLSFGAGGGTGSSLYFATELLKAKTGIKITIVNYRGAGPALNDLLGGHIDGMFDAMPVMVAQAKEGKVTPLAVTSTTRSPALPNVPTILESGVPDYEMAGWFGILAPAGTPPAIAQRLRDEVAKAVAAPDVVSTLASQGMEPLATQPRAWADYLKSELSVYTRIVKDANIKPE